MADEGFDADEEWDADFLDQIVQAEELALSAQPPRHPPLASLQPPPLAPTWRLPPPQSPPPPRRPPPLQELSYSPPRELSQRTRGSPRSTYIRCIADDHDVCTSEVTEIGKDHEVDRLQKELNHVSNQLRDLEKECSELRREKEKNLVQLKVLNSRIEAKDADVDPTKNMEMRTLMGWRDYLRISIYIGMALLVFLWIIEYLQPIKMRNHQIISWGPVQNVASDTGKDKTPEVGTSVPQESWCRSKKLFDLWNSTDLKQGGVLVAKLYKTHERDFQKLFGYLNSPTNGSNKSLSDDSNQQGPLKPIEYAKVLHLHSVFTKISNDILRLEDLLEALVDLCNLENVFIVHWSLRVLHKILSDSSSMEKELDERENVTIEGSISGNAEYDINRCDMEKESLSFANVAEMLKQGKVPSSLKSCNAKTPDFSGLGSHRFASSVSGAYQFSLFERMCLIATKTNEEGVRFEALSIMNLILMRHNAYLERDKFAVELVFQSLSQLLKEAGFSVKDQAVHALYLLCNCPKVIATISCLKEDGEQMCSKDGENTCSKVINANCLNEILVGLADCVACYKSATAEEMKLRRNTIFLLAFLGSSGKSGFEILLNHKLPKGSNFLDIILRSILSDLDFQASKPARVSGIVLEQNLLIREALILLNRLVSHPQYSIQVLDALTATRDMASMSVEVANRLTHKSKLVWQDDKTTKQNRESEILELARLFKKRVFTFLGDNIS